MRDSAHRHTAGPAPRWRAAVSAAIILGALAFVATADTVIDLSSVDVPTLLGATPEEQFGRSVAYGDLDGDGLLELVVGAPGHVDPELGTHTGAVYVLGRPALATLTTAATAEDVATAVIRGNSGHGRFGSTVSVADFDGDGIDDLAVGAPAAGRGSDIASGAVFVFFGADSPEWMRTGPASPCIILDGDTNGGRLGTALCAGDLDDDGAAELVVAAPRGGAEDGFGPGAVFVVTGAAMKKAEEVAPVSSVATARIIGERNGDSLAGLAIADIDGDGGAELVLGAYHADLGEPELVDAGRVYVVPAERALAETTLALPLVGGVVIEGTVERGFFGRGMAAGDIDGDGAGDLLLSSYASKGEKEKVEASGEAFVLFGGAGGSTTDIEDPGIPRFTSRSRWDVFGLPLLLADLNGDLSDDIIVSAQFADGPDGDRGECGEVYVFTGSLRSVVRAKAGPAEGANATVVGAKASDSIGGCLLAADVAGGKGPELIIGAPDAGRASVDGGPRTGRLVIIPEELLFE